MNTSELSIGNRVSHKGKEIVVKNISAKSINLVFDKELRVVSWIPAEELEPIPLTTERLRKLRFRLKYQRYLYEGIKEYFIIRKGESFFFAMQQDYNELIQVSFVHELQNMMFSWFKVRI